MAFLEKRDGFSLIEMLIIVGVASALIVMGGAIAGKFANRHSTDTITRTISSSLQLMRLKAAKQGVEYQVVLTFDPTAKTLTVVTQRGNSNRGTCSTCYVTESSETISVKQVTLSPTNQTYNFNPDGTLGGASGTFNIKPASGNNGERCGKVVVSPFGRISIVEGSWNSSSSSCSPVY